MNHKFLPGNYSVDLISDLNLDKNEPFEWAGKPTSLFCVVAGNISSSINKVCEVLGHLGEHYMGVFYIDGHIEHPRVADYGLHIRELEERCSTIPNVVYLHDNITIVNNTAFIAVNGWYGKDFSHLSSNKFKLIQSYQNDDLAYLSTCIKNLQLYKDTTQIVVVSNSLPYDRFLYGSKVGDGCLAVEPGMCLSVDHHKKVTHWLYGGTQISNDITHEGRRFANNPRIPGEPYWPKKINL